jgi:hypothetical protein
MDLTCKWASVRAQLTTALMPRVSIVLGIAMTMSMNIDAGLRKGPADAVISGGYAVALLVSLETLILVIRSTKKWTWERWAALSLAGVCAGVTGWVSYTHALEVLRATGGPGQGEVVHFAPVLPDQLILMGTVALIAVARHKRAAPARANDGADRKRRAAPPPPNQSAMIHEAQLVHMVSQMPQLPSQRKLADDHCGGNRHMAKRVLQEAAAIKAVSP